MQDDINDDVIEDDDLSNDEDDQEQEPEEDQEQESDPKEQEPEEDEDEDVITIEGEDFEPDAKSDSNQFRDLRKRLSHVTKRFVDTKNQLAQLQVQNEQYQQTQNQTFDPGPEPTISGCEYDEDLFQRKHREWVKNEYLQQQRKLQQQEANAAWQQKLNNYQEGKKSLKVKDYAVAEDTIQSMFNMTQQGIVIDGATNPAAVVYVLGKNPSKAEKLAKITSPVQFAIEIGKLEASLKISKRRPKTKPESIVKGTGAISGTTDQKLDRLRRKAEKTGNYTEVIKYKRELRKRKAG